ncbi:MAG: IPT/TIG domain-containing protein [Planctomycetota bacterium]
MFRNLVRELSFGSLVIALLLLLLLPDLVRAQVAPRDAALRTLDRFEREHPGTWDVIWNPATGYARFVSGASIRPERALHTGEDFAAAALRILAENEALLGVRAAELQVDAVHVSPLRKIGTRDKVGVEFRQVVHGVTVHDASVVVLFLDDGRMTAIDSQAVDVPAAMSVVPSLAERDAAQIARDRLRQAFHVDADRVGRPELVIYPAITAGVQSPRLAWLVEAASSRRDAAGLPIHWRYVIAADEPGASVLDQWNQVHTDDISGTVQGNATPGLPPDEPSNPTVMIPLETDTVTAAGVGTTDTDDAGYFVFPGQSQTTNVSALLTGPLVRVSNTTGGDASVSADLVPGTPGTLTFNSSPSETVTSQVNAFYWVNEFEEFLETIDPGFPLMSFQVLAKVNEASICNAFYDGSSINFFTSGGGCVNTSYSTVICHEEGHWANDKAKSHNGGDGFGEGAADVWALYICNTVNGNTDDPQVARDFCGPGCYIRTGDNGTRFCGDCCPGCYGEVHKDGEVLMGAMWKVRMRLKASNGAGLGNDIANALLVGWFKQYNQVQIKNIIITQWLTLDDDDGDLANGTPHYNDINEGFKDQGFPGYLPPQVDQIVPSDVAVIGDQEMSVLGKNLATTLTITISGNTIPFTIVSDAEVSFHMPQGAALGPVQVLLTNGSGSDGSKSVNYVLTDPPALDAPPIAFRNRDWTATVGSQPGYYWFLYSSTLSGPTCFPHICIGIGGGNPFSLVRLGWGVLNGIGLGSITIRLPDDPAISGVWYDQGFAMSPITGEILQTFVVSEIVL